jgi:hypothetical protein
MEGGSPAVYDRVLRAAGAAPPQVDHHYPRLSRLAVRRVRDAPPGTVIAKRKEFDIFL